MKNKLLLISVVIIYVFCVNNLFAQNVLSKSDSIFLYKLDSTLSIIQDQDSIISSLAKETEALKSKVAEFHNSELPFTIKYIPLYIAILTIVLTLFLAWTAYGGYLRNRDINERIEKFDKLEKEASTRINVSRKDINKEKIKILQIEKELSSHSSYLHQSIENYYDIILFFANISKNHDMLRLAFVKRAISQIYSFDEKERFTGITTVGESGSVSDIIHLEKVKSDNEELERNIRLAEQAIIKIRNRKRDHKNNQI